MKRISEYEGYAEECRRLATQMNDPEHKASLEQMAQTWLMLARERARQLAKQADQRRK